VSFGREHLYLRGEQIHLELIHKLNGIGIGFVKHLPNLLQPFVQLRLLLQGRVFVLPVGGKALLGNLVHATGTNLHFHPFTTGAHHSDVQGLITVGLGQTHPIPDPVLFWGIEVRDERIHTPALVLLRDTRLRVKHDAHSQQVINFLKRNALVLHLVVNRIDGLGPPGDIELIAGAGQLLTNRSHKLINDAGPGFFVILNLL